MIETAVYDTKPSDREYFARAACAERVVWRFHDFRLRAETAPAAKGAQAVCIFVNDHADAACLTALAALDVKLIALRCAGHNNVDLAAAHALGLSVVRVPAYSPHAVAEHAVGLLLTLNRKIHRAYNRVRELNFSLSGLVGFDIHGRPKPAATNHPPRSARLGRPATRADSAEAVLLQFVDEGAARAAQPRPGSSRRRVTAESHRRCQGTNPRSSIAECPRLAPQLP